METITYSPIGTVHSPLESSAGAPIQPHASDVEGTVEVFPEFADGLKDLDGFSFVILVCHMNRSSGYSLTVKPYLDDTPRGLFSTRAPRRPNSIGISTVELAGIDGNVLKVRGLDILDGTPLLDIKPFVPEFDNRGTGASIGWLEDRVHKSGSTKADDRFE